VLVHHVDGVVLAVRAGHTEEEREPAPEAESPLAGQPPLEDELVALPAEVAARLLGDAVHEDLEPVVQTRRELDARPLQDD
jgi:hypothetical protein